MMTCKQCSGPIKIGLGRRPKYCSSKCRQKAFRLRVKSRRRPVTPIYDQLCKELDDPLDPTWDAEWFR
jgi:hypothetical protein